MIDRRRFLQIGATSAVARVSFAQGQPDVGVKRIGLLLEGKAGSPPDAVLAALRKRGWIKGTNLLFEQSIANSQADLTRAAKELAERGVDLIVTFSTPATLAAKAVTTKIPILFEVGSDPVASGLVANMARPGGNATGFVFGLYDEKLLEILRQALPKASRVMYPISTPSAAARNVARSLGLAIEVFDATGPKDLDAFFASMRESRPNAVVVPNVGWLLPQAKRMAEELKSARMPGIAVWSDFAVAGGLLSYGPVPDLELRADIVDSLLRGTKRPVDIPVHGPTRFRLAINLVTAKALGVTIPTTLRTLADPDDIIRG